MKKLAVHFLWISILAITAFFSDSCANIGSITGGPKDTLPPVMIASKPVMADTSVDKKKVIIIFNEYFELKDMHQEFVSSPPFKEKPDFKVKKRGLRIKFKEPLQDSITYTLRFGNAIADYNEGNILEGFEFVFSTKSEVDSFGISGNLKNAHDLKPPETAFVALFKTDEDSIPYKELPQYMAKIDSSGDFSINQIDAGKYKVFAFVDANTNLMADFFEERAFLDSLVIPEVEPFTRIDTIKAGTFILRDSAHVMIRDSLENDTVIVSHVLNTYPNNLQLYLFKEKNLVQRMKDYERPERGRMNIFLDLPADPEFSITPLNFSIDPKNVVFEKNFVGDTITWWINDTTVMSNDSLEVQIAYLTQDTLGLSVTKQDTVSFNFKEKKDPNAWRRKKDKKRVEAEAKAAEKKYLELNFLAKENKVEYNKKLEVESPVPLKLVDTTKFQFFEIYDTVTTDPKKQEIVKAFRLRKDMLYFKFKRPIVEEFKLYPINFEAENWYTKSSADSNRVFTCTINNPEVFNLDTIKVVADYDNNFFFGQVQVLSDSIELPITSHKILSRNRDIPDKIELVFERPIDYPLTVIPDDFFASGNWYSVTKNQTKDSITINLLDKDIVNSDTLTFAVRCFDYIGLENDSVYFEETMRMTFVEVEQFLVEARRLKKEEIIMVYNKEVETLPEIKCENFSPKGKWYELIKNEAGDTLTYTILDQEIVKMDSLSLIFNYTDTDRKGNVTNFADSLSLKSRRKKVLKKKTNLPKITSEKVKKEETVSIYLPANFKLENDSVFIRRRHISTEWKEDTKYLLRLDSLAFVDIYDIYNKSTEYEFATRKLDYYTTLLLNLTNVHAKGAASSGGDSLSLINDSIKTTLKDSLPDKADSLVIDDKSMKDRNNVSRKWVDDILGEGSIIVQLLDKDEKVVREHIIKEDKEILMEYLHPGEYMLKIIFDRNSNGEWDTGDYFKGIQPERVISNGKLFKLAANLENQYTWNVGEFLINSFIHKKMEEH